MTLYRCKSGDVIKPHLNLHASPGTHWTQWSIYIGTKTARLPMKARQRSVVPGLAAPRPILQYSYYCQTTMGYRKFKWVKSHLCLRSLEASPISLMSGHLTSSSCAGQCPDQLTCSQSLTSLMSRLPPPPSSGTLHFS